MYNKDKHYQDMLNSLEERSFSLYVNNKKMIGFNVTEHVRIFFGEIVSFAMIVVPFNDKNKENKEVSLRWLEEAVLSFKNRYDKRVISADNDGDIILCFTNGKNMRLSVRDFGWLDSVVVSEKPIKREYPSFLK